LTSPSCSERDQLIKSFLETGAKKGEAAFFVTINPGPIKTLADEYQSNFHLFVCNPQADAIVKDAPNVVKLKGVENLTDISIALTSATRKLDPSLTGGRRICVGLVSDVLLQHHAVQTRRWLTGLIPELQAEGFTVLAIMNPQMHPSQEFQAILDLFDGEVSIFEKQTEKGSERYLKIIRMSNQKYMEDEVILRKTGQVVLDKHRLAVLPFVNMSPDPNDEYFADGMTEETISTVSGISGLSVISRTSVMGYKGTTKKVGEIGGELKAGSVLEGSFRKAGSRIRVTTQLIDAATDRHLWAQNYDRNMDDVFDVQSDIAKQVADALRVRVLTAEKERIEKAPTESLTAYTLYLKGRQFLNRRGLDDIRKAAECFEMAVKEDPEFALGYVGQADCCLILRSNWMENLDANLQKAKALTAKALELDSEMAEAHATKGSLLRCEYDLRNAEEEFRIATEIKPSYAYAHMWYFTLLLFQLRLDEALEEIEKAMELDPLSPVISWNYGFFCYAKKDYRKALEFFNRAIELGYAAAHSWTAVAYGKMKMFDEMKRELAAYAELVRDEYPRVGMLVDASAAIFEEDWSTVRRLLPEVEAHMQETGSDNYAIANCYFSLGEIDRGFEWLERSYSKREDSLQYIRIDEELDTDESCVRVRSDARYLDLVKRLGLDQTAQPTS
jgi:serine/threonine-protein kinase